MSKRFNVALSFPGQYRSYVEEVAHVLARLLSKEKVFYDRFHEAELSRLNLDTYMQKIYHDESDLVVVFLCKEYDEKEWCGLEFRAIRNLIKKRRDDEIMLVRVADGDVTGVFDIDGFVDARDRPASEIANVIRERLKLVHKAAGSSETESRKPKTATETIVLRLKSSLHLQDDQDLTLSINEFLNELVAGREVNLQFEIERFSETKRELDKLSRQENLSVADRETRKNLRGVLNWFRIFDKEPEIMLKWAAETAGKYVWDNLVFNEPQFTQILSRTFHMLSRTFEQTQNQFKAVQSKQDGSIRTFTVFLNESELEPILQRQGVAGKFGLQGWQGSLYDFSPELWVPAMLRAFLELEHYHPTSSRDPNEFFTYERWRVYLA